MKMAENSKTPTKLTKGSRYRIVSKGDSTAYITSAGEFMGYIQFGQDSGLLLKLIGLNPDLDGTMRIIPSMTVLYIDILEVKEEEEVRKKDVPLVSYG
jgi:hypothetical protein